MGEAKRRKQLGLMPVVHHYVANVADNGQVTLISGPSDPALQEQIKTALSERLSLTADWPSVYRRAYVMAGMPERLLRTAADVQAIPVPQHRRVVGQLLLNYDMRAAHQGDLRKLSEYVSLSESREGRGLWLHYVTEYSDDGRAWSKAPEAESPRDAFQYLMQHPITQVTGEVVGRYQTEHDVNGQVTIEPEPPAEYRSELVDFVRHWNGETPEKWRDIFAELHGLDEDEIVPQRIRLTVELRQPAPFPGLFQMAAGAAGDLEVFPAIDEQYYSLDGETWLPYDDPQPFDDGEFDYVLAHADGSVEWDEADFNAEQRQAVLQVLGELYGVGDPDVWQVKLPQHMADIYDDDLLIPEGQRLPAPQSIGISVEPEFWRPGADRREHVELIEFTYSNDDWYSFYVPELPAQLQPYANPDASDPLTP